MTAPTTTRALRPYQVQAVAAVHEAHDRGVKRPAVVMATGTGKTTVIARLALDTVAEGKRVVVLAHQAKLLSQIAEAVGAVAGRYDLVGVVQAGRNEVRHPIVAAMVQTLSKASRLAQLDNVGLVIVDECHHAAAASYQTILGGLGAFHTTPAVGFTATLSRGDDKRLGDTWDEVVFTWSIRTAIDAGNLVQPVGKSVVLDDLDLTAVKRTGGDYADGSLGEAIAAESDAIARTWATHAADRKTMVFVPSVQAAYEVAESLQQHGAQVEVVVGTTPLFERDDTYRRFRASELNVLVSVAVLTEGFDEPTVDCILMARPTQLAHVYIQAVGRGLRPAPGKSDCLVLDVVGVARLHSLVTLVQLDKDAPYKRVSVDGGELDETVEDAIESERAEAERQGVEALEDIDLFASSDRLWLHTRGGVRFIPAGDELVFLWPVDPDVWPHGDAYRVGRIGAKAAGARDGWVGDAYELADAREVAERVAGNLGAGLSSKTASWRRGNAKPSEAQVTFAKRLGIADAASMTKARVSDEISIAFASRRLDV